MAALLTSTGSITLAIYTAIFHRAWMMSLNFTVAGIVEAIEAFRLNAVWGPEAALRGYGLLLLLNLAAPFGIQAVVHVLRADAVSGEHDQLTGLLTRRAFHLQAKAHLVHGAAQQAFIVICAIDLDRFKQLNDNHGHPTGDDALVAVARALRDTLDHTAVIGGCGGEEFLNADIWRPEDVDDRALQLCNTIAALPFGITANIGTGVFIQPTGADPRSRLLIELIAAADTAMYTAKRAGGNQACLYQWPLPPTLLSLTEDNPD